MNNDRFQQWLSTAKQVSLRADERELLKSELLGSVHSFQKTAQGSSLTALEKESMKEQLFAAIRTKQTTPRASFFSWLFPTTQTVALATVFLVLFSSVGTAVYAAEDAVPGDSLYSVKVNFTEPMLGRLYRSDQRKATFEAWRYERRLYELTLIGNSEQLQSDDRLTEALEAVEKHTFHIEQALQKLPESDGMKSIRSHLETKLSQREQVLEQLRSNRLAPEQIERLRRKGKMPPAPGHRQLFLKEGITNHLATEPGMSDSVRIPDSEAHPTVLPQIHREQKLPVSPLQLREPSSRPSSNSSVQNNKLTPAEMPLQLRVPNRRPDDEGLEKLLPTPASAGVQLRVQKGNQR